MGKIFEKPSLTADALLGKLKSKGLIVKSKEAAINSLETIGLSSIRLFISDVKDLRGKVKIRENYDYKILRSGQREKTRKIR